VRFLGHRGSFADALTSYNHTGSFEWPSGRHSLRPLWKSPPGWVRLELRSASAEDA